MRRRNTREDSWVFVKIIPQILHLNADRAKSSADLCGSRWERVTDETLEKCTASTASYNCRMYPPQWLRSVCIIYVQYPYILVLAAENFKKSCWVEQQRVVPHLSTILIGIEMKQRFRAGRKAQLRKVIIVKPAKKTMSSSSFGFGSYDLDTQPLSGNLLK